jgi:putative lipase involved disintegration of autophagic bodies
MLLTKETCSSAAKLSIFRKSDKYFIDNILYYCCKANVCYTTCKAYLHPHLCFLTE